MTNLSHLKDDPRPGTYGQDPSERLNAVLVTLPKYNRVRIVNALSNQYICTLADLCAKTPRQLRKWKQVGKKCVADLTTALAAFGLALATSPSTSAPIAPPRRSGLPSVVVRMTSSGPVVGPVEIIPPKNAPTVSPRSGGLPPINVKMTSSGPVAGPVTIIPPKITKPRISLIVDRVDGRRSSAEISGVAVTADMLASAEDLLHTLTTGERPLLLESAE